ncbi:SAM-dependent methyltransferase [Actinoallomurus sp. NBC_01490]|uniref:SAM-dependent methyltransferase n=1 Tax=Actinoallomurus sp. NBC_01490 TaxID=2903557 RepID=UPI002E36AA4F|nr:SAM-dependent methyltransferase [Actinoallomurus sp. NBC_01490]
MSDPGESAAPEPDRSDAPAAIDTSVASPARMYDYYLGGTQNFASDRRAAQEIYTMIPELPEIARDNRAFLRRAVRTLADAGIRQFVDIGSGLPTQGSVHEIAREADPASRVVYVDNDPLVLAHARTLPAGGTEGTTAYVAADLREPDAIFTHPDVRALIDIDRPIGLLLVAVLHFITDEEDPRGLVGRYRSRLAPGSHIAIAHATRDDRPPEAVRKMTDVYERASAPFTFRTREQILSFFHGTHLLDPGLVYSPDWRREPDTPPSPSAAWNYAGVGLVPPER